MYGQAKTIIDVSVRGPLHQLKGLEAPPDSRSEPPFLSSALARRARLNEVILEVDESFGVLQLQLSLLAGRGLLDYGRYSLRRVSRTGLEQSPAGH